MVKGRVRVSIRGRVRVWDGSTYDIGRGLGHSQGGGGRLVEAPISSPPTIPGTVNSFLQKSLQVHNFRCAAS